MEASKAKIVIVGDGMVGKSCICKSYANKETCKSTYQPTIGDRYEVSVLLDNKECPFVIWDTAGCEEWDQLRIQDYAGVNCFILCYSIENYTSYSNIASKWAPELKIYYPKIPVILVGTKQDLRSPTNFMISRAQGRKLANIIGATAFTESSKMSISSIEGLFMLTLSIINDKQLPKRKFSCNIL